MTALLLLSHPQLRYLLLFDKAIKRTFIVTSLYLYRLAAVFLAGKVEECRVGIRDLLEVYDKCSADNIKACELLLIEVHCCATHQ